LHNVYSNVNARETRVTRFPGKCPVLKILPGFGFLPGFHDLDKIISFFDKIDQ
jgi:hypothetical protein